MPADRRPAPARRRGRLLAVGAAGAVGAGVLAVGLLGPPDPGDGPTPATPSAGLDVGMGADVGVAGGPAAARTAPLDPAAAADSAVPAAAPDGVSWELFRGVALPTHPEHGPTRVDGPVHAGFSRTPVGALLADAQINIRRFVTAGEGWRRVTDAQLLAGPGRDAYVNLRSRVSDEIPPGGLAQYVGFRFLHYSPDLAVLSLATRGPSGTVQVGTDTLRWVDGDWRLEVPASGLQSPQAVSSLAGYVPWAGVS